MAGIYCTDRQLAAALGKLAGGVIADHGARPDDAALGLMQLIAAEQKYTTPPAVVVATPTIMGGLVLCWYRTLDVARYTDAALVSASRSGVMVNGRSYLHDIPAGWITDACRGAEMIQHGQSDRAREMATHEPGSAFRGEIVEVKRHAQS